MAQANRGWDQPDPGAGERDLRLVSVASTSEAPVEALERRIRALETRNGELEADKRKLSRQIDQLQNLVDQLQFALESTLEDLDRAGKELAVHEERASQLPPPAAPAPPEDSGPPSGVQPASEPAVAGAAVSPLLEAPLPADSRTQAVGRVREPTSSGLGVVRSRLPPWPCWSATTRSRSTRPCRRDRATWSCSTASSRRSGARRIWIGAFA